MKLLCNILYAVILLFGFMSTAQSALIALGDYTTDTDTGLDWLDLDLSLGLSLNQVNAELGAGGLFEGYQVATLDQAQMFLSNAGWIGAFEPSNNLNTNFVASFKSQTTSLTNDPVGGMGGFTDDPTFDLGILGLVNDPIDDHSSYSFTGPISPDFSDQNIGTFLLRATVVPVPTAFWLFVSGFLLLISSATRNRI